MKHIYKTSTALFMALAVFAMIFTGCKKSDSNNGGGVTPVPPTSNYGTITLGDQSYTIIIGGYSVDYSEELQANVVTIALADGTTESANVYGLAIPYYENIPTGTFEYVVLNEAEHMCMGVFTQGATQNAMICMSGTATITQSGSKYKIVSSGLASDNPLGGTGIQFSVNFEGPLVSEIE